MSDLRGIFFQKAHIPVVRVTLGTTAQAFRALCFPVYWVALDLVSLTLGACCGVSTSRGR
jgi:hypothetical protein